MLVPIRWVLVPFAAVAVWFATWTLGFAGMGLLDSVCPQDLVISDHCTADWYSPAILGLMLVCTSIVAFGVVFVPALVAPAHRFRVALVAFACGAAFAIYMASSGELWHAFVVSAISGSAALWVIAPRFRPRAR